MAARDGIGAGVPVDARVRPRLRLRRGERDAQRAVPPTATAAAAEHVRSRGRRDLHEPHARGDTGVRRSARVAPAPGAASAHRTRGPRLPRRVRGRYRIVEDALPLRQFARQSERVVFAGVRRASRSLRRDAR